MTRQELRNLWLEIDAELQTLRPAFNPSASGTTALKYFDEFLSANEFGLALDTLCDFLLESDAPTISPELLGQISGLHHKMGIDDNRVGKLRQKAAHW
jgi:hypothetical protein